MPNFTFYFKFKQPRQRASGTGHVDDAVDIDEAKRVAIAGVAKDFDIPSDAVKITSIAEK